MLQQEQSVRLLCHNIYSNILSKEGKLKRTTDKQSIVTVSSVAENTSPNFIILRKLNPNITGTARKNVNSAAATLETPINNAPIIVEPEREVPGIIDKI